MPILRCVALGGRLTGKTPGFGPGNRGSSPCPPAFRCRYRHRMAGYNPRMETVSRIESVEESQTRSGNTRYVVRDSGGNEYTTFRPQIGQEAAKYRGTKA